MLSRGRTTLVVTLLAQHWVLTDVRVTAVVGDGTVEADTLTFGQTTVLVVVMVDSG